MRIACPLFLAAYFLPLFSEGQTQKFTREDTLKGSNTEFRSWWDVQRYNLDVTPEYGNKSIAGSCEIHYTQFSRSKEKRVLQIDLQDPMVVDSIWMDPKIQTTAGSRWGKWHSVPFKKDGDFYFVTVDPAWDKAAAVKVFFHGKPREAKMAPWDGGWVWAKDKKGRPWMGVACEGIGASVWFPCKDIWSDEPDIGASFAITVPDTMKAVANGRLKETRSSKGLATFVWEVKNPINAYNIIPYIGQYTSWSDTLKGENGKLNLTYWVLDYEKEKAQKQFTQVKPTLRAFEHWFGAYPFYEDGYQLIQAPYLGMEHQSAVAYGNEFKNGYLGEDLSGTGWGLKWDYIIVHETGHEWFGNNITAKDVADMWIQEGFTDYSESLFTEYYYGKAAGNEYTQGLRKNIENDAPIIGQYGVRNEGSGDMYYKGANLIHTIRQIINNDNLFRGILRGLNEGFRHQTITTQTVEQYISTYAGKDLSKVFDQYLRTIKIPVLEYKKAGSTIEYRWTNVVAGFEMPVRLTNGVWLRPSADWKTLKWKTAKPFEVDKNFYITLRKL